MRKLFPITTLLLLAAFAIGCGADTKPLSNSTPLLEEQTAFADRLAELSGLNQAVVEAWVLAESSGQAAKAMQKRQDNNWLNLAAFDSSNSRPIQSSYQDPVDAAQYTFQQMKTFKAGQDVLAAAGKSPDQQIDAIANSDWAASGYNNGQALEAAYKLVS